MMKKLVTGLSAMAMIASLAACGGANEPAENVAANDMNTMMADPNNPFAQSELAMDQAINAAVGVDAADSWARKMIEHHKGAVEMSRIVLAQNPSADVAKMAQQTIDKQTAEVTTLEKLIATGNPDPASAELYKPAAMDMHNAMMAAKGTDVSDTWVRKMLEHHKGGVTMSDIALANGATGPVRAQIEKTKSEQQKEIDHIEGMLSGQQLTSEPTAAAAESAVREAPAKKPAAGKPVPLKPKAAETKPAEPKAPTPDCPPEHHAAGHC